MFLIDNVLTSPMRGLLWIFKEIHEAAEQEQGDEAVAIKQSLIELYESLESGAISEEDFDANEKRLLDRLDELEGSLAENPEVEEG